MTDVLGYQNDYFSFISGISFFLLSAVCFSLNRAERLRFPWNLLGLYGIAFGSYELLDLIVASPGGSGLAVFKLSILVISSLFLAEFCRNAINSIKGWRPGWWLTVILFSVAAPGALAGPTGLTAALNYIFGLGVGIWSAVLICTWANSHDRGPRLWLTSGCTALLLNALINVAASPEAPFFPARVFNSELFIQELGIPLQLIRGLMIICFAVAVWRYWQVKSSANMGQGYPGTKYRYNFLILVLFVVLAGGWVFTQHLDRQSRNSLLYESGINISSLTNYLKGEMSVTERAVVALAENSELGAALTSGKEEDIERANAVLDRFQFAFSSTICYLIDTQGDTIASSNRYNTDSFVGKNYGFRPYFRQAMDGGLGRYFALGVTSGERGYYTSCPVRDSGGNILGVAVIKKQVNNVETEFNRHAYCFLIDYQGQVFLSSRPDLVYSNIWPQYNEAPRKVLFSRQISRKPVRTLVAGPVYDGESTAINDRQYLVSRRFVNPEGWSVILFTPTDRVLADRLLGILTTLCLSVITISFFISSQRLTESSAQIAASEATYRAIFNAANDAIYIHSKDTGEILDANRKACEMYGFSDSEDCRITLDSLISTRPPYSVENALRLIKKAAEGQPQLFEWQIRDKAGRFIWVEVNLKEAVIGNKERVLAVVRDISGRKETERVLMESEAQYRTIFENTGTALAIVENDTSISLVNAEFEALSGYSKHEIEGKKTLGEFVAPGQRDRLIGYHDLRRINVNAAPRNYEFEFVNREGNTRNIDITVAMIPGTQRSVLSLLDITERKLAEEKLVHLSQHDTLTGLYNRASFEDAMRRLDGSEDAAGIILCDVNGLKLVNDSLGHEAGDKVLKDAAKTIKKCFRDFDIVARIGGDEFAVLLPGGDNCIVEKAAQRIKAAVSRHNQINRNSLLSLSIGFAVRSGPGTSMADLFKEADNNMYKEKFHSSRSARSAIVKTLMKALEARDVLTESHADRLQKLVADLAAYLELPDHVTSDLRLLAKFHDIGKVGIPDRILFKPAALTRDEDEEMRRHCEIGHRIAQSVPELTPIADLILKHHEWWNGQGYPNGLSGENIPLECRIISIADAYDAMTSNRPYRKAMSHGQAMAEIKRCAGTQFDPVLAEKFLHLLEKRA